MTIGFILSEISTFVIGPDSIIADPNIFITLLGLCINSFGYGLVCVPAMPYLMKIGK